MVTTIKPSEIYHETGAQRKIHTLLRENGYKIIRFGLYKAGEEYITVSFTLPMAIEKASTDSFSPRFIVEPLYPEQVPNGWWE